MKEEYAYILDIIKGKRFNKAQAIGEKFFILLELSLKDNVIIGEKVYIGPNKRDKVWKVDRKLKYENLTGIAKSELESVLKKIIKEREQDFVNFINNSPPISIRMHSLELLPNLGKKKVNLILEERKKEPFKSFEDIKNRIKINIEELIIERILKELKKQEQYYLFVH